MAGVADAADAAAREREAAMPHPVTTARRGITVGRYMGLSEHEAATMVMCAAAVAAASARKDGITDTTWLDKVHGEAQRIYVRTLTASEDM